MNDGFEQIREMFPIKIGNLMTQARQLIREELPGATEVAWVKQKTIGYGIGPHKMSEHCCWMAPYPKYVLVGFNYGSELPDPQGLLEGAGQLFRHVKLRVPADVQQPALRELVRAAVLDVTRRRNA